MSWLTINNTTIAFVFLILALGVAIKLWSGKLKHRRIINNLKLASSNQIQESRNKILKKSADQLTRTESRGYQELNTLLPPCCRCLNNSKCIDDHEKRQFRKTFPIDQPHLKIDDDCVSPTGFTISEILQIGQFPDYAALSGFPLPEPCLNFDMEKAKARPYRPFRWPYHQTMGKPPKLSKTLLFGTYDADSLTALSKLEPNYWLEIDSNYRTRLDQRRELVKEHGADLYQALPGSELALKELSEVAIQFLCNRYPAQFSLTQQDVGEYSFHNHILGTSTDLTTTKPLDVLASNVPEDFVIMLREPDTGRYRLRAGIICSAIGWSLGQKMDKPLADIHEPVPDYAEKMEKSMDRWFAKVGTDSGIQRGSWSWERGEMLYWSPDAGPIPGFNECDKDDEASLDDENDVHLRIDWQTLRRLPLTGAIVFNFKALFTPLSDLIREPGVPALALKILNEGKQHVLKYKGVHRTERVVKKALKRYAEKQVEMGLVSENWEVGTLDETPFWKGWEEYY